ncbi:hypothetical protein LG634_20870 [Streptomyces bambusae]|uniref:hypothetical protein n=1 Tax=Streptomyces bambusae TaxID=1550616 RepID=UPI001CFEF27A|nr:hypothetical protein [Streptomyces bambusae]MCB5167283.1 hypothetical protein [Streptomyces bambusae]
MKERDGVPAAPHGPGAPGPAPGGPPTGPPLLVDAGALVACRRRADDLLARLETSPAAPARLAAAALPPAALGTGFPEAARLARAHARLHAELTGLSRALALQLGALADAVAAAGADYSGTDAEAARDLRRARDETERGPTPGS